MKKHLIVSTAVAVFSLVGASTATVALADVRASAVVPSKCPSRWAVTPKKDPVKIRKDPSMGKTVGTFPIGAKACGQSYTVHGGKYKYSGSCTTHGKYRHDWDWITYKATKHSKTIEGWVPDSCVKTLR